MSVKPNVEIATRPDFEERWKQRFREFAQRNENDAAIAGWSASGLNARLVHFARVWPGAKAGELWLDAGCGAGTYSRFLAQHDISVLGLDYSLPTIAKAKARDNSNVSWGVGDATRLPIRPQSVDGVLCFGVTQALSSSQALTRELSKVVKLGGTVWLDALNGKCLPHWIEGIKRKLQKRPPHLRYESPAHLRKLLAENGLHNIRLYWLPILPQRFQRYQWMVESRLATMLLRYVPLLGIFFSHAFVLSAQKPK